MRIYLAGSISGGREFEEGVKLIARILKDLGHEILSEGFVVSLSEEDRGSKRDEFAIVKRDLALIRSCDAFVAEVSSGSHGVGYEHRVSEEEQKPLLLLRHGSLKKEAIKSAFLEGTGYPKLMFAYYDKENIRGILEGFFNEFFGENREGKLKKERE